MVVVTRQVEESNRPLSRMSNSLLSGADGGHDVGPVLGLGLPRTARTTARPTGSASSGCGLRSSRPPTRGGVVGLGGRTAGGRTHSQLRYAPVSSRTYRAPPSLRNVIDGASGGAVKGVELPHGPQLDLVGVVELVGPHLAVAPALDQCRLATAADDARETPWTRPTPGPVFPSCDVTPDRRAPGTPGRDTTRGYLCERVKISTLGAIVTTRRCHPPGRTGGTARQRSRCVAGCCSIRRPEMARAMTSCWICSVPSKMS